MLRRTYAFIVSEWKILLGIVIGLAAYSFMIERNIIPESSAFSLFIDVWISFGVIRSIVFNVGMFQKGGGTIPREFPRFSYFLKYAFVIIAALFFSFLIFYMTPWWRYLGSNPMFLMTFTLIALPIFAILFTFLGTWLVADVYGEEKGFGDALVRGSERFFPNFAKYLLLFLCQIILFGVVVIFLPKLIPQSLFPLEGKLGWLPDAVFYFFASTIRVLGNIAWAVLAAMMYMFHLNLHRGREAEPAESATVV